MKHQAGFSLIMAIFILLVLGLLGGYMVSLQGVQTESALDALQGARAYQAARAGIEWSLARLSNGGSCSNISAQTAMTFSGLEGFSVRLACSASSHSEATQNLNFYKINALSQSGSYGGADYWARELEITFFKAN
ncbi:MAG: hypothetical protein RL563_1887 [Pseudomonadota bacterium]|jgi:MSHA biogenesis protein MshP